MALDYAPIDDTVQRHARAIVQHHHVMEEAARIARVADQARNRAAAVAILANPSRYPEAVRARVEWEYAS